MTPEADLETITGSRSSCVKFTKEEYFRMRKDALLSGHSIPWLLKTAYFQAGVSAPNLGTEEQKAALRELNGIGRNINQLAHHVNSGLISHVKEEFQEIQNSLRTLKAFLCLEYGDSKNSV